MNKLGTGAGIKLLVCCLFATLYWVGGLVSCKEEVPPLPPNLPANYPHHPLLKDKCTDCHTNSKGKALKKPLATLCLGCHKGMHKQDSHPVSVRFKENFKIDLPLDGDNVACISCHDQHGKNRDNASLLRKPFDNLCKTCHQY